jgi:hypothetical protein
MGSGPSRGACSGPACTTPGARLDRATAGAGTARPRKTARRSKAARKALCVSCTAGEIGAAARVLQRLCPGRPLRRPLARELGCRRVPRRQLPGRVRDDGHDDGRVHVREHGDGGRRRRAFVHAGTLWARRELLQRRGLHVLRLQHGDGDMQLTRAPISTIPVSGRRCTREAAPGATAPAPSRSSAAAPAMARVRRRPSAPAGPSGTHAASVAIEPRRKGGAPSPACATSAPSSGPPAARRRAGPACG